MPHDPAAPSPPPYRDDNLDRSPAKARFTSTRDKYGSPRVSKLTAGTVKLGGPLTPFPSEVMKPEPQGLVLVPKVKVDLARARYTKGRDMPSRPTSATTAHSATSMVHYQTTKERLLKEKEWERVRDFSLPNRAQFPRPAPTDAPPETPTPHPLPSPTPASQVHPRQFIKVSRTARPGDREGMAPDPTVETARTALEKRRALEHEAAVAHLEKLRVEAIEERDAAVAERRALTTAHIRREFGAQRERRRDWCERAVATAAWKPMDANRFEQTLAAERDLALTYDPKGLAETMRSSTTYAAYFEEHARCTRATAAAEGGCKDAGSGRSSRCENEERERDARAVAELDDFDARVGYFHETSLRDRCKDRGWILSPAGRRTGGVPATPTTLRVSNPPVSFQSPDF